VDAAEVARRALRWVADAAQPTDGGLTWPETREPGSPLADDLYSGTAGALVAFAEARLCGIDEFDHVARSAVGRLATVAAAGGAEGSTPIPAAGRCGRAGSRPGCIRGSGTTSASAAAPQVWGRWP
jgi:hypothetical protein